jgi:4a-hydroxytetrahydrobiopterin dehydratase
LKYEIEKRLQFVRAVVDVEDLKPGQPFPDRIRELIGKSHATIAVIGPKWMPSSGMDFTPPNPTDTDWVVTELQHSMSAPIDFQAHDRYGLDQRIIVPLFVTPNIDFRAFRLPDSLRAITSCNAERITAEQWPAHIGPMLDRLAVTYKLKKRPDADEYPKADPAKARTQPMPDEELRKILSFDDYDGWYVDNFGNSEVNYIVKTFKFPHFNEASSFMSLVSDYCKVLDHHPEWRNVFNHVSVSLTTWDAKRRVTIYDLNLALYMNKAHHFVLSKHRLDN